MNCFGVDIGSAFPPIRHRSSRPSGRCQHLKESNASPSDLLAIFDAPNTPPLQKVASTALAKGLKVFYFDRANGEVQDISGLDPSDEESGKAGWGGLIEFSGRANDAVANAVANAEREDQP